MAALRSHPDQLHRVERAEETAAGGRLQPAERAADGQRLAGDDAEDGVALVHRVRVEDPGHLARARADVRRRDVLLRADLVDDLARVAARHPFELADGELLRVAGDAALGAAEGDAHQRALPGHPHRQRAHLVERDVGVVADAALRRPTRDVVRDAVALEDLDVAVVHRHGDRDGDRLLALREDVDDVVVDRERPRDLAKLRLGDSVGVLAQVRDGLVDRAHGHTPCVVGTRSYAGAESTTATGSGRRGFTGS